MAISMVGAATIWRLIYEYQPAGTPQIGLLNAIVGPRSAWTRSSGCSRATLHLNSLLLMIILIWTQVGFSMVLLSSAIKGVPEDTLEAARIDGASERQIFFRVVVPQIGHDDHGLHHRAHRRDEGVRHRLRDDQRRLQHQRDRRRFYNELFTNGNNGAASAIVVMLMIAIIPVLIYQVRHFRAEEANG